MQYKILYTKQSVNGIKVKLINFSTGQLIEFTLDELEKNNLDEDLKQFVRSEMDKINQGYYNYSK